MTEKLTKIEKELLLIIYIAICWSFRADIAESLEISSRTLTRYLSDINGAGIFKVPIERDPNCPREYVAMVEDGCDEYTFDICSQTVDFSGDDTAIITHLKRVYLLYITFKDQFHIAFDENEEYSWWYDEDSDIPSLPSASQMLLVVQDRLPMQGITTRTIQRDIRLIGKTIRLYNEKFYWPEAPKH